LALLIAYLWLGDIPSWIMIIGGTLALGGVLLANRPARQPLTQKARV